MEKPSILSSCLACSALCALLGLPNTAHADVLQIEEGHVTWIAGGPITDSYDNPAEPASTSANALANGATLPTEYAGHIITLAARYDLSPALIEALVWQESRWRPGAVSPKGARGLAQLMPDTAKELGVDPDDPFANLEGGARYLRLQLDRFDGDLEKALAAYNAGPGRVERASGIPRIRETQDYVASIIGRLSHIPEDERMPAEALLAIYDSQGSTER